MKKTGYFLLAALMTVILTGCTVDITLTKKGNGKYITDEEILENIENARAVNPWGETQSLFVASEWADVDLTPPEDEIKLDDGRSVSLITYRYMTGIAEALYRTDENELTFRQSREITPLLYRDRLQADIRIRRCR